MTTPSNATGPVPVLMEMSWKSRSHGRHPQALHRSATAAPPTMSHLASRILAKAGANSFHHPTRIQRKRRWPHRSIIGLVNKGQNAKLDDWGALRAWAWGDSRAIDYFETDKSVDARQVGLEGHSRYGKAVLVTLAYDKRSPSRT